MNGREFARDLWKTLEDRLRLMEARDAVPAPATPIEQSVYTGIGVDMKQPPVPGPGIPWLMGSGDGGGVQARLYDYNFMANLNIMPRAEIPSIASFAQLTFAYNNTDDIKVAHEWRTDRLIGVDKEVVARDGVKKTVTTARLEAARRLVEFPDPLRNWSYDQWTRVALKQETITDALTIYPLKTYGGDTVSLMQVDGRTIKPIVDYMGAQPLPPGPAYSQYIKGYPYRAFSMDDLLYMPSRPNYDSPYGESRVEQIMNIARISRDNMQYEGDYYQEGNIPEAILSMPLEYFQGNGATVSARVMKMQTILDEIAGKNTQRRRLFLAPLPVDKMEPIKTREFSKELPDWLVRRICIRFGCPSHLFLSDSNRSTAQQVSKDIHDGDFSASLKWMKQVWDRCLAMAGFPDIELKFKPTRNFDMVHIQGVMLAASTALPVTPENPDGLPAITRAELRGELGYTGADKSSVKPDTDAPATPSAPAIAGDAVKPALAPGKAPAAPPARPGALQGALGESSRPPRLGKEQLKASAVRFHTERDAHTRAMLGQLKPILAAREDRAIEQAKRAAAHRGKKVGAG